MGVVYCGSTLYSVREFMAFTSDVLVGRTGPGQRQSVKEQGKDNINCTDV